MFYDIVSLTYLQNNIIGCAYSIYLKVWNTISVKCKLFDAL